MMGNRWGGTQVQISGLSPDQESVMAVIGRLPRRFPVGTRYVLEGVPAKEGQLQVISRLIVLPNGQQFDLTNEIADVPPQRRSRRAHGRRRRTKH
jgi:hypothetical protein